MPDNTKLLNCNEFSTLLQIPGNLYSCKVEIWDGAICKRFYMHNVNGNVELFSFDLCRNLNKEECDDLIKNSSAQQKVSLSSIVTIEREVRRRLHAVDDFINQDRDLTLGGKVYTLINGTADVMIGYDIDDVMPLSEVLLKALDLANAW